MLRFHLRFHCIVAIAIFSAVVSEHNSLQALALKGFIVKRHQGRKKKGGGGSNAGTMAM